jgi:hypothetical protein
MFSAGARIASIADGTDMKVQVTYNRGAKISAR